MCGNVYRGQLGFFTRVLIFCRAGSLFSRFNISTIRKKIVRILHRRHRDIQTSWTSLLQIFCLLFRLWSDYQYGTNVALACVSHLSCDSGRSDFLSPWWTCWGKFRASAPNLYINWRCLISFGNESLYYWFWLQLYICLQFVPHPSMSTALYITPTIHLQAWLTVGAREWTWRCVCGWVAEWVWSILFQPVFSSPKR